MEDQQKVRVKALTSFNHGTHDAKKGDELEVTTAEAEDLYKRKLIERVPNEPAGAGGRTERTEDLTQQGKDGSGIISNQNFPQHPNKASPPSENK